MRLTRLGQFFREAGRSIATDAQVRTALREAVRDAGKQLLADSFQPAAKPKPVVTPEQRAANADYVKGLYRELLQREPDVGGFNAHMAGLEGGTTRAQLREVFLNSAEYQELLRRPPPAPTPVEPPPAPAPRTYVEPGPALTTVPPKEWYLDVPVDTSSDSSAVLSAARWVREHKPEYFNAGDDRAVAFKMMGDVIGILRAHGYDSHRVVNHPSRPQSDGYRYGSDALVLGGNVYDVYLSWGDPNVSRPQALNHGPYSAPGRLRE